MSTPGKVSVRGRMAFGAVLGHAARMNTPPEPSSPAAAAGRSHVTGHLLVLAQLALIALLGWLAAPRFLHGQAPVLAWLLAAAGVLLGGWALSANRPGNFNVHPAPKAGARLVESGPYRWIRHPMYSAVILCGIAAAVAEGSLGAAVSAGALGAVLTVKSAFEELWMRGAHPGYAAYRARTRRFVPGVF